MTESQSERTRDGRKRDSKPLTLNPKQGERERERESDKKERETDAEGFKAPRCGITCFLACELSPARSGTETVQGKAYSQFRVQGTRNVHQVPDAARPGYVTAELCWTALLFSRDREKVLKPTSM